MGYEPSAVGAEWAKGLGNGVGEAYSSKDHAAPCMLRGGVWIWSEVRWDKGSNAPGDRRGLSEDRAWGMVSARGYIPVAGIRRLPSRTPALSCLGQGAAFARKGGGRSTPERMRETRSSVSASSPCCRSHQCRQNPAGARGPHKLTKLFVWIFQLTSKQHETVETKWYTYVYVCMHTYAK